MFLGNGGSRNGLAGKRLVLPSSNRKIFRYLPLSMMLVIVFLVNIFEYIVNGFFNSHLFENFYHE